MDVATVLSPIGANPTTPAAGQTWRKRPVAAVLLRITVFVVPVAASIGSAYAWSLLLPRPGTVGGLIAWVGIILSLSAVTLVWAQRMMTRFLPLVSLLRLTLAFPGKAPSRVRIVSDAGSERLLREKLEHAQQHGLDDEPSHAVATILALVIGLSRHDAKTRGHVERTRRFAEMIAKELEVSRTDRERLRWAALLHDIGKLGIPATILNKPTDLTEGEWGLIHNHPLVGAHLAEPIGEWLGEWIDAIEQHHERWDGTGYPNGLAGSDISFGARIVAVADAYECMTAGRPYQVALGHDQARAELVAGAGTQFDPSVVRALLGISVPRYRKVAAQIAAAVPAAILALASRFSDASPAAAVAVAGTIMVANGITPIPSLDQPPASAPHHLAIAPIASDDPSPDRDIADVDALDPVSIVEPGVEQIRPNEIAGLPEVAPQVSALVTPEPIPPQTSPPRTSPIVAEPGAKAQRVPRFFHLGVATVDGLPAVPSPLDRRDTWQPTQTQNLDPARDDDPGQTLQPSLAGASEGQRDRLQTWAHELAAPLQATGTATLTMWSSLDHGLTPHGLLEAWLLDCPAGATDGVDCESVASTRELRPLWAAPGDWTRYELAMPVDHVWEAGRVLMVKVTVNAATLAPLWISYGSAGFDSLLRLPVG